MEKRVRALEPFLSDGHRMAGNDIKTVPLAIGEKWIANGWCVDARDTESGPVLRERLEPSTVIRPDDITHDHKGT